MSSMGAAPGAIRAIRSVTGPHSCHLRRKVSPKPQQNHRPGDVHSASRMILMMNVHFPHFPYASMIFYVLLCHMSPRTAAWQAANANLVDLTPDASSMTSSSSSRGAGILTSRAPNEVYRPRHRARCSRRFRPSKICVYCQSLPPCK